MEQSVVETTDTNNGIKVKMHFTGKVLKTSLAGALVDIGSGKPAYLHIARIASPNNQPIKKVADVLKEGQEIEVWVKRVVTDRVELTMFKPLDLEWRDLQPGMVVKGKVVKIENFGAFVEIGAERPALVHVSEMAHEYVKQPTDKVKEGDEIEAQIIDIDRKKKQIKLSMKALQAEAPKEEEKELITEKPSRTGKRPSRKEKSAEKREAQAESEPEQTAMEIALRHAMGHAKDKDEEHEDRNKRIKGISKVQEDIFSRTLEQKEKNK
jgi:ribosomal protein S1